MEIWKAHYKDANHDMDLDIINSQGNFKGDSLSFRINGYEFTGVTPDDFELKDKAAADEAQKEFCLLKWGGHYKTEYVYTLQGYSLDVQIPVKVVRISDNGLIQGFVRLCFEHNNDKKSQVRSYCDDEFVYFDSISVSEFSLTADGKTFCSDSKSLDFETGLIDICSKMKPEYSLKCCFNCQYSDYSPYGNNDYGTMLCYKNHKSEYLKVNNKAGFFESLEGLDYDLRQETFICSEFEKRVKCSGYRGFVE